MLRGGGRGWSDKGGRLEAGGGQPTWHNETKKLECLCKITSCLMNTAHTELQRRAVPHVRTESETSVMRERMRADPIN